MPSPSLLAALVRRSATLAQPFATAYAEGNMLALVRITNPGRATFDRESGQMVDPEDAEVYTGKARMYDVAGGTTYSLGDEPVYFANSYVSIPVSAPRPQINNDVQVLAHPDSTLIDRHYRVIGVDTGGLIPAVHRLTVVGAEPSPTNT